MRECQYSTSKLALVHAAPTLLGATYVREKDAATKPRETIARIHAERGPDLSGLTMESLKDDDMLLDSDKPEDPTTTGKDEDEEKRMTVAELTKMRTEIMQKLE